LVYTFLRVYNRRPWEHGRPRIAAGHIVLYSCYYIGLHRRRESFQRGGDFSSVHTHAETSVQLAHRYTTTGAAAEQASRHSWSSSLLKLNPLIATLKPHSNRPSYSNTVTGTLAVDGWVVTFCTTKRGLGGAAARPVPSSLYLI